MARSKKPKDDGGVPKPEATPAIEDAVVLEPVEVTADADPDETSGHEVVEKPTTRGIWPFLLGGAAMAALGVAAVVFAANQQWILQGGVAASEQLATTVRAQRGEIDALKSEVAAAGALLATLPRARITEQLNERTTALEAAVLAAKARLDGLEARLVDLENRPIPDIGATADAVAAYERELAAMREMFAGELRRIEAAQSAAVQVENKAAARAETSATLAAVTQIRAAIDSGESFDAAIEALQGAGIDVPAPLATLGADGVATLAELQSGFAQAARGALNAAVRADVSAVRTGRLAGFLRTQLGARSLEPREGDDADA
ncbi:MAG: COG4223 family protein, partial [Paracoccaceae bacterium]